MFLKTFSGVICNSGKEWREQRHVTELGIHHTAAHVHQLVDKEVAHLITAIKQEEEKPFNPNVRVINYSNRTVLLQTNNYLYLCLFCAFLF